MGAVDVMVWCGVVLFKVQCNAMQCNVMNESINQSINQSMNQSINQSFQQRRKMSFVLSRVKFILFIYLDTAKRTDE
jgi:hypothetical protein